MKDFGDLLEHALYTPAGEVEGQEIRGGEQRSVEQIGEQNNRLLPWPIQRHTADAAPVLGLLTPEPPPVLFPDPPLRILPALHGGRPIRREGHL